MKQENRQQYGLRFELMESRQQVDLGGNPEDEGAEEEIDRENVHGADLCLRSAMQSGLPIEHIGRILGGPLWLKARYSVTLFADPYYKVNLFGQIKGSLRCARLQARRLPLLSNSSRWSPKILHDLTCSNAATKSRSVSISSGQAMNVMAIFPFVSNSPLRCPPTVARAVERTMCSPLLLAPPFCTPFDARSNQLVFVRVPQADNGEHVVRRL